MIEIFRIDHLELSAICKMQLFRVRYVQFAIIASVCLCHIGHGQTHASQGAL